MARNYVWLEHLGRPFAIDANDVQAVYADANGNTVLDIVGSDRSFGVCGTVEEVAARLGIPPRPAGDEAAIGGLSSQIMHRIGYCWVAGPGVPARYLGSNWTDGTAALAEEDCGQDDEFWGGREAQFLFDARGSCQENCDDIARWLWGLGYREVVAAPEAETKPEPAPAAPPSEEEQADLLAGGKRLRFERPEAMGSRVPVAVEAIVHGGVKDEYGDERYHGYVGRPGSELEVSPLFQSEWGIHRVTTARRTLELLSDLGYRFVAVVD